MTRTEGGATGQGLVAFRGELRTWLASVERPHGLRDYGATPTAADVEPGRQWQATLADAGWACVAWPQAHGGRSASLAEQAIFAEECARAGVPRQLNFIGPNLVGPVLLEFGTDAQQSRWLPRIRSGEDMWCQLFSEPDAGSDLAGLRTRATPADDGWVIEGEKMWSSGAANADFGLLLARTGPERLNLSMFVVPMSSPGVEARPIRQMDGDSRFNSVTFLDVELDGESLLASVGDGWKVAMTTLGNERLNLGGQAVSLFAAFDDIVKDARGSNRIDRDEAAAVWSRIWLLSANFQRLLASGRPPSDPMYSLLKLMASELQRDLSRFGMTALGAAGVAGSDGLPRLAQWFLAQPGQTLAGGTSEIQRNILAERVLGLPR